MINKVNKPITYFLISFLIIFILSFSVIFIMEKEISKSKSEDIMASETRIVTTKTQILEDALYRIIGDLGYLNHVYSLRLSENVDSPETFPIFRTCAARQLSFIYSKLKNTCLFI